MAQVNTYDNKAAYTADSNRSATESAVSFITENNESIFDGVNITVEKQSAAEGDLAVWDSVAGGVRFVKAATLVKAQLPTTLTPFAVVIGWRGDKVLLASLYDASMSDWNIGRASSASRISWAHGYEMRISGINAATAGTLTFVATSSTTENITASWSAGTLATVASAITTAFAAANAARNQKWRASVDGTDIILTRNWDEQGDITSISGTGGGSAATISAKDDTNLQITYTYLTTIEYIRRENGVNSYFAGANYAKFYQYHRTSGTTATGIGLHSTTILNEASFTEESNPIVYAAYNGDYKAYLFGEHFAQYPSAYGTMKRDGKETTEWLATKLGTNVRGESEPRYPAAWLAANYGVDVEGFGTGAWWLPSIDEMMQMMRLRRYNAADTATEDAVNDTLVKVGGSTMYSNDYYPWTCSENSSGDAFFFGGSNGTMYGYGKYSADPVRPVSAF